MDWKWFTNKVVEVLCNLAFIGTVVVYTIDYSKKLTTAVSEVEEDLQMSWPSLTFCTNQGYKKQGFHYKESEYLENTFALEDIFATVTLEKLADKTRYKVSEIRSDTNGRCYTVQDLTTAKLLNWDDSTYLLKRNHDLVVIVQYPGDEFFITRFIFPLPPIILDLQVKAQGDLYSADLHLDKEEINLLSKKGQCRIYKDQDQKAVINDVNTEIENQEDITDTINLNKEEDMNDVEFFLFNLGHFLQSFIFPMYNFTRHPLH